MQFSIWKRAIFRNIKKFKCLSGGVVLYAAQSNPRVDEEIAEKGRFGIENKMTARSGGLFPPWEMVRQVFLPDEEERDENLRSVRRAINKISQQ